MQRNRLIAIVAAIVIIILVALPTVLFNSGNDEADEIMKSKLSASGYYVIDGLKDIAPAAASAVENFASQDVSELKANRDKRLAQYFSADSPVYNYSLDNIGGDITKSVAKVTSITDTDMECGGETEDITCALVFVETKFYYGKDYETMSQSYWVRVTKQSGKYTTRDVGIMK